MDTCCQKSCKTQNKKCDRGVTPVQRLALLPVKAYRYFLSPLLGSNCRFHPSCSHYAQQAIERHGLGRGIWLTLKRLCRCHPWGGGGYDPVPEKNI